MLLKTRWKEEGFKEIVYERAEELDNISDNYFPLILKFDQPKREMLGSYLQKMKNTVG